MWNFGIFVKLFARGYLQLLLNDIKVKLPEEYFFLDNSVGNFLSLVTNIMACKQVLVIRLDPNRREK